MEINDERSLRAWLSDKPSEWAQSIGLRAALRAIPYIGIASDSWLNDFALLPLQALVTSWIQLTESSINVFKSGSQANARYGGHSFNFSDYNEERIAAIAADSSYHVADAQSQSIHVVTDCVRAVENAAEVFRSFAIKRGHLGENGDLAADTLWFSVQRDCHWLASQTNLVDADHLGGMLAVEPVWLVNAIEWGGDWNSLLKRLHSIDPNYIVWMEWYGRRIRGKRAAFDIPGDKGRVEDKKILARLAEATDEDFWGKGHEYVNATLKGWLEEARARVAPPPIVAEASGTFEITGSATAEVLDAIKPDPQDARSPTFGSDASGRIAIKANAGADQLRSDPQSLSRHARALQMAQKLGEALRNHNNAGYMTGMVDDYVAAMGYAPECADPSGLVFAGDQIREVIAKHRAAGPNDDLQPLPPSADRDASGFLSAHNMYVGSDPFLDDLDRTTRGPDAPLPAANPDEIRRIVNAAREADILAEPTYDYMVAASKAAPAIYDQDDRHSRFAAGLAQNFARYGVEFLWAYPNEAAWAGLAAGIGVTVALGPVAALGGTVAGVVTAYNLARNMIANESVYEKLLATSPAGEDNFNRLMRFLKSLPIKSLKDD